MPQQTVVTSSRFSLNLSDWAKSLVMAVGGAVFGLIQASIQSGSLDFDWKKIGLAALGAAVVYIGKNFFDAPRIVVTDAPPETVQAVKDGDATVKVVNK